MFVLLPTDATYLLSPNSTQATNQFISAPHLYRPVGDDAILQHIIMTVMGHINTSISPWTTANNPISTTFTDLFGFSAPDPEHATV
jgi:hypothetical protein